MLKKTVTYTDFNNEEKTETFYFNLSKAELVELEMRHPDGYGNYLQGIVATEDGAKIIDEFKKLVRLTYGVKSDDGSRFIKSAELADAFMSSEAYSELFMDLVTDADAAANFVTGVIPANLEADVERLQAKAAARPQSDHVTQLPTPPAHPEDQLPYGTRTEGETEIHQGPGIISKAEAEAMSHEEFANKLAQGWKFIP